MEFTSLFLENVVVGASVSINGSLMSPGTLGSSLSSTSTSTATEMTNIGEELMNSDNGLLITTGSISTSVGTSTSINGMNAYEKTLQQLETTQAYVESLNQKEMEDLLAKLEIKESELLQTETQNGKYVKKIKMH